MDDYGFKELKYPGQDSNDIQKLCIDIKNSLYSKNEKKSISDEDAKLLGQFMVEYNNVINNKILTPLSLRDIFKIFKRIVFQKKMSKDYLNIKIYHNILFYILSSISNDDLNTVIDFVVKIIENIFSNENNIKNENLKEIFKSEPKFQKDKMCIFKDICGISNDELTKKDIENQNNVIEENITDPTLRYNYFKILQET